jgi:hypothetical protein
MTTYVVHTADGEPVSFGTVLADPLPEGLIALALSDEDAHRLLYEGWRWNPATLSVDTPPPPSEPDPIALLQAQVAELQAQLAALLAAATPQEEPE